MPVYPAAFSALVPVWLVPLPGATVTGVTVAEVGGDVKKDMRNNEHYNYKDKKIIHCACVLSVPASHKLYIQYNGGSVK